MSDYDKNSVDDLLIKFGVLLIEADPNVVVNGQPQQKLVLNPEYQFKMKENQVEQSPQIIDITETANPRRD